MTYSVNEEEFELAHIGTKFHSGRYPWGSGKDPEQRGKTFSTYVKDLEKKGLTRLQIAEGLGLKTTEELRFRIGMEADIHRADMRSQAIKLLDKGYSNVAIGKRMGGLNESTVRSLLDDTINERKQVVTNIANALKDAVKKQKYVDIGTGVEYHMGVNRTKLKAAIFRLKQEGYQVQYTNVLQGGTGKKTSVIVLTDANTTSKEVYAAGRKAQIQMPNYKMQDFGHTQQGLLPVTSIKGSRVAVRYHEDGGSLKDGVIELRRGVDDISLGNSKYAQVRIGVDGTHFLKGMAMYTDAKLPKGVDVIYNTNKTKDNPRDKVFKAMVKDIDGKIDLDNPFGSSIKPGGQKGVLNIVNEEGDWVKWSRNISSQVLSKQSDSLAKRQLSLLLDMKREEFDEIQSLTNPTVKKRLLETFADEVDSAAVHLKGASLPRQDSHIILPITSMKENEIYAPNFKPGERVVLIRHPHGGTFEIPELVVNNKNPEANRVIKGARDAVGIHPKVAERLSGADFDGDTVIVIPNTHRLIKTTDPLPELSNFNPKTTYKAYSGMPKLKDETKQLLMGDVSNLITDMTIKGATRSEIARAVRHSMVVIDAEKHHLDYKQSARDHGIKELKQKYQGKSNGGASTLISRAKSEKRLDATANEFVLDSNGKRHYTNRYDPVTNKKVQIKTGETYIIKGKNGGPDRVVKKTTKTTKMEYERDAFKLSSGSTIEAIYAEHANALKDLANRARGIVRKTGDIPYSKSAHDTYKSEVEVLKSKLRMAYMNKPLERQAQFLSNKLYNAKKDSHPDMDKDDLKKMRGQILTESRLRMGAEKAQVKITDNEWKAIQLGAVSKTTLNKILLNTDVDALKQRAMPRTSKVLSPARAARAKSMLNLGHTRADVASALGISVSLLDTIT